MRIFGLILNALRSVVAVHVEASVDVTLRDPGAEASRPDVVAPQPREECEPTRVDVAGALDALATDNPRSSTGATRSWTC
jgi:hypothetical protein